MRQIFAMGGGGFSMEPENLAFDVFILSLAQTNRPKVCLLPTASGDHKSYIDLFYSVFDDLNCEPTHLSVFSPKKLDLESYILEQDIIYVTGGHTRNMMVLWKSWGIDEVLKKAYQQGVVMAGVSAGAVCWFKEGITDSVPGRLSKDTGLGLVDTSWCSHFENRGRKEAFTRHIYDLKVPKGYGVNNFVGLHFTDEQLSQAYTSRDVSHAHYYRFVEGTVVELPIPTVAL